MSAPFQMGVAPAVTQGPRPEPGAQDSLRFPPGGAHEARWSGSLGEGCGSGSLRAWESEVRDKLGASSTFPSPRAF